MYDRLSDWIANVSLLFMAMVIIPFFRGNEKVAIGEFVWGAILTLVSLWLSLRLARQAEGEKNVYRNK